jgi:phosphatidylserine/phosphatidylglycerophosphate/cardiolipin synthase-like enzyme
MVADASDRNGRGSKIASLMEHHIPVRLNDRYAIMHDKFMVIDGHTVELGSFNYTAAAEHKNAENVLVLHNAPEIAARYVVQWQAIWEGGE